MACNWTFRPLGIKNVFLHLNETMHMKNHLGFIIIHFQIMFAFYGFLSIASTMLPKLCSVNFPNFFFSLSFNAIRLPLHFFQLKKNSFTLLLLSYVDDLVLIGNNFEVIGQLIKISRQNIAINDLGKL